MPTPNAELTDHQASLVEQREAEDAYRLEALRSAVQLGIDDIVTGKFKAFERKEPLRAHLKSITHKAIAPK